MEHEEEPGGGSQHGTHGNSSKVVVLSSSDSGTLCSATFTSQASSFLSPPQGANSSPQHLCATTGSHGKVLSSSIVVVHGCLHTQDSHAASSAL